MARNYDHTPNNLRILLLAETANPEWVSVPLIGWSLSQAISRQANTHIVTQVRNRQAFIRAGLVEGTDFTAIDNELIVSPLSKLAEKIRGGRGKGWTTSTAVSSLAYYSFELMVWRQFRERLVAGEFNIVHRVTPVSPTSQSLIAKKLAVLGIPFILGPLNGGVPWPARFMHRQEAENEWLSNFRWLHKMMPYYQSTRKYASAVICGSRHTYDEMPESTKRIYLPENGVDLSRFSARPNQSTSSRARAAFIGRLVPYKGADLLLRAASDLMRTDALELHIIGDGPQMPLLRTLAQELSLGTNLVFHGWVQHENIHEILQTCDFTVLPSIREFGGGVIIESMAMGVPAIVADYGGPAELVDPSRGIRVAFHDEASLIDGLKTAIFGLVHDRAQTRRLGEAGRAFVESHLTWDAKAKQILDVYAAVASDRTDLAELPFFPNPKEV